jgi:metal-sulfur cluster biosynthetic enzyme
MLIESQIQSALRDCFDTETKLNLVDLGAIDAIATGPDPDATPAWPRQWVRITMTLPNKDNPGNALTLEQVHNRLAGIPDISKVEVNLVWQPAWTPHRITPEGKRQLAAQAGLVSISSKKEP